MSININTINIRTETKDYFKYLLNVSLDGGILKHNKLLVLDQDEDGLIIRCIGNINELTQFSREIQVIGIWPGSWRSDFFTFTVGEYLDYIVNG